MLSYLKSHPFAVEAFFDQSLVLTYAVPAAELAPLLPPCLVPDTWQQHWGFVAVALVQTRHLRPQHWPAWLGHDFYLIGYRIFVRYTTAAGRRLRGLYILRSETNNKLMELGGNLFTHYRYHTVDVAHRQQGADPAAQPGLLMQLAQHRVLHGLPLLDPAAGQDGVGALAAPAVEPASVTWASGSISCSQSRHWAAAWPWVSTMVTSSSVVPGRT